MDTPTKRDFLSTLYEHLVSHDWDIPTPGRESDLDNRYWGPDQPVREAIKESGRQLAASPSLHDLLIGVGLEALGHYYLSLEAAINQERSHPAFEDYFGHWIHSDPRYIKEPARQQLTQWFQRPGILRISRGQTYWL